MDSLYQLTDDYQRALSELEGQDDEFIADTLEGLKGTIEIKSTNVAKYIQNLFASADAIDTAIKQMTARKKALTNKADRIKKYLKDNMEVNRITRIECPEFVIKIVNNPPKVVLSDEIDLIPAKFKEKKVTITINKNEIKKVLSSGKAVSGCALLDSTRIEIK